MHQKTDRKNAATCTKDGIHDMWATTLSVICVICLLMSLILLQLFLHHKTIMAQMKQCVHNIHVHIHVPCFPTSTTAPRALRFEDNVL